LKAITSDDPTVLLIDEIDKADAEFEAFLLELIGPVPLDEGQIASTFSCNAVQT
jgi:hypothetical protein